MAYSASPRTAAAPTGPALDLTLAGARALLLAAQGLLQPPEAPAAKPDVLQTIRRMGALQIDTIHVVARSLYFVLWSRLGAYEPAWLDQLLDEGLLFEYWSHAACLLPGDDYPLYRRLILERLKGGHSHDWINAHSEDVEALLARVRDHGAVRSSDFVRSDGRIGTWWDWKPEKLALERLHSAGVLMTARRHNFQRIYDLRERVRPDWTDADAPSLAETKRLLALKTVRALGVTTAAWVPDYFRLPKAGCAALLESLAAAGELLPAKVEGWQAPAYVHPDYAALAIDAAAGRLQPLVTTLLSPFDPVVWDRARARTLFNFDYTIECYTPAAKRRYGYFTLPILHRGILAGRVDAKAHRKAGVFEVKALHIEPGIAVTDAFTVDLAGALRRCAHWHKTPALVVRWTSVPLPSGWLQAAG